MEKIYIATESDRLTVAAILIKNQHTVRVGKEKRTGSKSYDYFLEYERNPDATRLIGGIKADEG